MEQPNKGFILLVENPVNGNDLALERVDKDSKNRNYTTLSETSRVPDKA
jgi:hypothetical protein